MNFGFSKYIKLYIPRDETRTFDIIQFMNTDELQEVHKKIFDLYHTSILPVIFKYFSSDQNAIQEKDGGKYKNTLVSSADLEVNKILTENLPKFVTNAVIISEESENNKVGEYTFIIDPIDGTHSFLRNLDDWGITIELCYQGEVVYSVIFYPHSKTEYYYAIKGLGAFDSNDKKIKVKKFFEFKPSFVCAPASRKIGRVLIDYSQGKMLSFRAYGSCVYAVYTLLRGGNDFLVFDDLNIWDILGCVFIAEQSGLVIHWFSNKPKLDGSDNLKEIKSRLIIYKADYDKEQIEEIKALVRAKLV